MARRERVPAEAAESMQRAGREVVQLQGKVTRKPVEWDKQEALFAWDAGLKREAVCSDENVAAELFCACEEGYSYVY